MSSDTIVPITFLTVASAIVWLVIFSLIVDSWRPIRRCAIMSGIVGTTAGIIGPILCSASWRRPMIGYDALAFVGLAIWSVIFGMISGIGLSMTLMQEFIPPEGDKSKTNKQSVIITRVVGLLLLAWAIGINIFFLLR